MFVLTDEVLDFGVLEFRMWVLWLLNFQNSMVTGNLVFSKYSDPNYLRVIKRVTK